MRSTLAPLLRRLVQQWLRFRAAEAFASTTLWNDDYRLRFFADWLEKEKSALRSLPEIDRHVLDDYALALAVHETEDGHRLKASTRHGYLSCLAVFFRWLEEEKKLLVNPARHLPFPKVPRMLPRGVLTAKEIERVLRVPDLETPVGLRDRALLEVLYSTGIRNAEIRALKVHDLNFAEGLVTVHEGKGKKDRVVPFGRTAARFLERYLEEVRPELGPSRFEKHIFLSRFAKPLSKTQLVRDMERIGKRAGLGKPLTCHGLRHTCATHLLKGRADIRHIQELLGHKSLSTTEIYTHVAPTDLKRVHERCHPRERS